MKIFILILMASLVGCSTIEATDSEEIYRIENGALRLYNKKKLSAPLKIPITEKSKITPPKPIVEPPPVPVSVKKTSKQIQERLKRIQILTE